MARHGLGTILAVAVSMLVWNSPAWAVDGVYDRTALSGESEWMDEYFGWNNDCSHLVIEVDVVDGPTHGTISHRNEPRPIPQNATRGKSGSCAGKEANALVLEYTSEAGYRGPDKFRVRMKARGQSPAFFLYYVTVE